MKNLLIAFLLAIFSFQGAFAAIGDEAVAAAHAESIHACMDGQLTDTAKADGSQVSSAIEELSDYVPRDLPLSQARYPVPFQSPPYVFFRSIDLPIVTPPPRA